jgi:hypothetical protein
MNDGPGAQLIRKHIARPGHLTLPRNRELCDDAKATSATSAYLAEVFGSNDPHLGSLVLVDSKQILNPPFQCRTQSAHLYSCEHWFCTWNWKAGRTQRAYVNTLAAPGCAVFGAVLEPSITYATRKYVFP